MASPMPGAHGDDGRAALRPWFRRLPWTAATIAAPSAKPMPRASRPVPSRRISVRGSDRVGTDRLRLRVLSRQSTTSGDVRCPFDNFFEPSLEAKG
jgi:hypothetical protein